MLENKYKTGLCKRLEKDFPDCMVIRQDPNLQQGIPDLIVLIGPHWVALEVKKSAKSPYQPNQEYYLKRMHAMSYSATIYPENEEEVLDGISRAFGIERKARSSVT